MCAHQSTALVLRVGLFPCFCSSQSQIAFWGQGEGHDSVLVYVFVKEGVPTYMGRACFTSPLPGLIFGLDFCPARSKGHRLKPKWVASVNTLRTEVALVFLLCCLPLWGDIFSSDLACCFPTIFLALQIKFFLTQHFTWPRGEWGGGPEPPPEPACDPDPSPPAPNPSQHQSILMSQLFA